MKQVLDNLSWIEELLPHDILSIPKHGGMAYYLDEKFVLLLVEQRNSTHEHKGVTYPFALWNGCIFPVEYRKQNAFFLKFSFLENHPANKDWLYIPAESDSFDEEVKLFVREITKRNPLLGTPMKFKTPLREEPKEKPPEAKAKKKSPKAAKTDKKRENAFLLAMANKQRK